MTRNEMLEKLHNGVCTVTFTKMSGEERVMPCTLKSDFLPIPTTPLDESRERTDNDTIIKAYCTDIKAWRSFKVDRVISFVEG